MSVKAKKIPAAAKGSAVREAQPRVIPARPRLPRMSKVVMAVSDEKSVSKILLHQDPFIHDGRSAQPRGIWPATWIGESKMPDPLPHVSAYRLAFTWKNESRVLFHVSADERYELYLDGQLLGRGPERGDLRNWFFETRDVVIAPGRHVLVARVWALGRAGPAPYAQHSARSSYLLAAQGEGVTPEQFNTGRAAWEVKRLSGVETRPANDAWGTGAKVRIVGERFDWDYQNGGGGNWHTAVALYPALTALAADTGVAPWLRPAVLPDMVSANNETLTVRHISAPAALTDVYRTPIRAADQRIDEQTAWNEMLRGGTSIVVPARSCRRVIIDTGTYVCAYPHLVVSGGKDALIRAFWMESLVEALPEGKQWIYHKNKGNRAEIENKFFWGHPYGVGDEFILERGDSRRYSTLWWQAGRYVEVTIETADEAAVIEQFRLEETHYPHDREAEFQSPDQQLSDIARISWRTLEMCSHETYMDCPFFEQLQYVGDTRLQALITYVSCRDARLPKKAIEMFDASRDASGLTQSRYPSAHFQRIAPFSLWWVAMVHDFAMWRHDTAFVTERLPGVRAVLDGFASHVDRRGLLGPMPGWNYLDWGPGFVGGVPKDGADGVNAALCLQHIMTLRLAAQLETAFGEPELAMMQNRRAQTQIAAVMHYFYSPSRQLFADDLAHTTWSEHTQALAILTGLVPPEILPRVSHALLNAPDLLRTSIYFSHYFFEALAALGQAEHILERLSLWHGLLDNHLHTTIEMPEPTRSDCHAWGAHPLYHFHASILGVRPAAPGFKQVQIRPALGSLAWAGGRTAHPSGVIETHFKAGADGLVNGRIVLPAGVSGTLIQGNRAVSLSEGINIV